MTSQYFTVIVTQNCRKYVKLCYNLTKTIDHDLIGRFEKLGVVEIRSAKAFLPQSKDTFQLSCDEQWQLSGLVEDTVIQLAMARQSDFTIKNRLESEIISWWQSR